MWPVLFSVFGIQIQSYGVSKALAALVAAWLLGRAFRRLGFPVEQAHSLLAEDDEMDRLRRSLFHVMLSPAWKHGVEAAIDIALLGRYYERIADRGVHVSFGPDRSRPTVLEVDTVVLCTGQESVNDLGAQLAARGISVHVIGGADVAAELDAKRAELDAVEASLAATPKADARPDLPAAA